ncbi:hypothetical protein EYF80_001748 [Liparis tanakae]|uniref:Uncharacterized protein n=1 Tax=Liparis tanakae TaxID=230148 RepID=A0A4Z2JDV6_9TELE|nr:hypothetical protein EYF80_001748 [Liparis tanakae]
MPTLMSSSMASSSPGTTGTRSSSLSQRERESAEQRLKLSQQADGVQLTEESVVTETNTTSRRYCSDSSVAMVAAPSCISRNTMAFWAWSAIMATHSVSVVSSGYSASLHWPARQGEGRTPR